VKPLLYLLLSLSTWLPVYPVRSGSNNCLALLRPVVNGDFWSPTFYRWLLKEFIYEKNDILELTCVDGQLETGQKSWRQPDRVLECC
jgi:hypothetical protein